MVLKGFPILPLLRYLQVLYIFAFFNFLAQKMLNMTISTSNWGAQHPNAGQNIQHAGHNSPETHTTTFMDEGWHPFPMLALLQGFRS